MLTDYQLPYRNGLLLGWELKQQQASPRVIIYSAFADAQLTLAAALAGLDAVLDKTSPVEAIFETIRAVAAGRTVISPIPPHRHARRRLAHRPAGPSIFGLAVAGDPPDEIAAVLGMDAQLVKRRIKAMIEWLRPRPRADTPGRAA